MSPSPIIRRVPRPGDLGAIVAHHGATYAPEYGLDSTFEEHVGASVSDAVRRGFPRALERIWIVEREGIHAGSLALTDAGDAAGVVRWFLLDRSLRGQGLGSRLLDELLDFAASAGYETLGLETFSDLRAAARIYRQAGFELRWSETGPRWGRDELTYQRYELSFHDRAQSWSAASAGSSAWPFSVSE